MTIKSREGEGQYQPSDLMTRLAKAQNQRVYVSLLDGTAVSGKLNHVGPDRTKPGKGYIIVDYGMSRTIDEDEIKDFSVSQMNKQKDRTSPKAREVRSFCVMRSAR